MAMRAALASEASVPHVQGIPPVVNPADDRARTVVNPSRSLMVHSAEISLFASSVCVLDLIHAQACPDFGVWSFGHGPSRAGDWCSVRWREIQPLS